MIQLSEFRLSDLNPIFQAVNRRTEKLKGLMEKFETFDNLILEERQNLIYLLILLSDASF